jgi:hypothetical protein
MQQNDNPGTKRLPDSALDGSANAAAGGGRYVGCPSSAVAISVHSASSESLAGGRPARRYQ